ncbi:hypothetical protein EVAR_86481_1 [Eumeta japonica]|uniref:Uncharacterized protein n=1 Tax=Eumeta variegata TaxID=151549 RepID=A0A4C1VR92_EUMVA|nr:hypothetical protein EVAR_86481_1 [Eumeta japonica]
MLHKLEILSPSFVPCTTVCYYIQRGDIEGPESESNVRQISIESRIMTRVESVVAIEIMIEAMIDLYTRSYVGNHRHACRIRPA